MNLIQIYILFFSLEGTPFSIMLRYYKLQWQRKIEMVDNFLFL